MEITRDMLALSVEGRNFEGPSLGETLGDDPCLLVFLRHLG